MLAQIRTLVANREYSDIGAWPWIYVRVKVPPASELRSDNDITGSLLTAIISTTAGGVLGCWWYVKRKHLKWGISNLNTLFLVDGYLYARVLDRSKAI